MEGKIISIEGFKAVGLAYFGDNKQGEIVGIWNAFNNQCKVIRNLSKAGVSYGLCDSDMDSEGRFYYTACVAVDSFEDIPEGMVTKVVTEGKYLVYTYEGAIKDLGMFYNDIFTKWVPASEYEMDFRPQLEVYDERFNDNGVFDIYIPIK